jgi:hypothetical protein
MGRLSASTSRAAALIEVSEVRSRLAKRMSAEGDSLRTGSSASSTLIWPSVLHVTLNSTAMHEPLLRPARNDNGLGIWGENTDSFSAHCLGADTCYED